ncbi:hypothetical protein [Streptomyces avermitilis]|uniref:hypothetical protein n=1 Tax=Streptomyces avermitilis TaxID=33903 RepID=UPI0037FA16B1
MPTFVMARTATGRRTASAGPLVRGEQVRPPGALGGGRASGRGGATLKGPRAVVVVRPELVDRPTAQLLLHREAT